ncbi:hypothetical protein [Lacinutrix neustonica]
MNYQLRNYRSVFTLFSVGVCIFILQSCAVKKYIPQGELLYTGAYIDINADSLVENPYGLKTELETVLRPEPNSKFLGMQPGLYYYYKVQREKPGFINKWLYKQFGEDPVYQSDVKPYEVEDILVNRLENNGFFYSQARATFTEDPDKKEASVTYTIKVPSPYKIETYQIDSVPSPLQEELEASVAKSNFKKDIRFDLTAMKLERERLDAMLKRKGYYNFNPRLFNI